MTQEEIQRELDIINAEISKHKARLIKNGQISSGQFSIFMTTKNVRNLSYWKIKKRILLIEEWLGLK